MEEVKRSFTIKFSEWLNWEKLKKSKNSWTNQSSLYRIQDKTLCCLGIISRDCGVPLEALDDVSMPANLLSKFKKLLPKELVHKNYAETIERIILFNDTKLSDKAITSDKETKELRLKKLQDQFKHLNIKVRFVDDTKKKDK